MNIFMILLLVGSLILQYSTMLSSTSIWIIFMNPYVLILSGMVVCYIFIQFMPEIRNLLYKKDEYNDMQILNRDIDAKYNPSITAYLMEGKIDIKTLAADIMNLYAKKIINIEKQSINNKIKYKFTVNEEKMRNEDIICSDKYIIDTVIQNKYKFKFKEWESFVTNIFLNMDMSKKQKNRIEVKTYLVVLLLVFAVPFIFMLNTGTKLIYAMLYSVMIVCVVGMLVLVFINSMNSKAVDKIDLNEKGKAEAKKWIKFKKYIEEYTLLKDRNIEDIILYEKYIPYAVALEVNLNYKDTIFSAFEKNEIKNIIKDIIDEDVFENYFKM